jgi:hypothetical protein
VTTKINNGPKLLHQFQVTLLFQASNNLSLKILTSILSPKSQLPPLTSPPTVYPPILSVVIFAIAMSSFSSGNSAGK